MGEYAERKIDGQKIKIGTCENMYYIRYDDRHKVRPDNNSLDCSEEKNLFWRLPFPDEDNILVGGYKDSFRALRLYDKNSVNFRCEELAKKPGNMQLTHESGLLVNVTCYHGEKLPESSGDFKPCWNGKSWDYELESMKNHETKDGVIELKPIVKCRHCRSIWRFDWDDIKDYIHGDMYSRLKKMIDSTRQTETV